MIKRLWFLSRPLLDPVPPSNTLIGFWAYASCGHDCPDIPVSCEPLRVGTEEDLHNRPIQRNSLGSFTCTARRRRLRKSAQPCRTSICGWFEPSSCRKHSSWLAARGPERYGSLWAGGLSRARSVSKPADSCEPVSIVVGRDELGAGGGAVVCSASKGRGWRVRSASREWMPRCCQWAVALAAIGLQVRLVVGAVVDCGLPRQAGAGGLAIHCSTTETEIRFDLCGVQR